MMCLWHTEHYVQKVKCPIIMNKHNKLKKRKHNVMFQTNKMSKKENNVTIRTNKKKIHEMSNQ